MRALDKGEESMGGERQGEARYSVIIRTVKLGVAVSGE